MKRHDLGIAVIGAGRIGTLRARLAAKHPAVRFLAISDRDPARAEALAVQAGADLHSADNDAIIAHPEVTAVIVSTPEQEHVAPVVKALALGKPVLVEKPLALTLKGADDIIAALHASTGDLRVGYSRRYKECFLRAKEQMLHHRLGRVVGGTARVYNSRAQAFSILKRDPHATPVLDVLTYYVDLMCWFLDGNRPVEVVARGQHGIFRDAGYDAHDVTWAIVTFADGAVINLGVSYALPARYPTLGQSDRVELLGTEGTMIIDDDHMEHLLFSEQSLNALTRLREASRGFFRLAFAGFTVDTLCCDRPRAVAGKHGGASHALPKTRDRGCHEDRQGQRPHPDLRQARRHLFRRRHAGVRRQSPGGRATHLGLPVPGGREAAAGESRGCPQSPLGRGAEGRREALRAGYPR
jgi:predicted dehydrogenase